MQTLWIPGQLPGLNEMIAQAKRGGRGIVYSKKKSEETDRIAWLARAAKLKPMKRVYVALEWREPDRSRNKDNIRAGVKYVLDGLVTAGILENDGWSEVADIDDDFIVDKENPGVRVTLCEELLPR